MVNPQDSVSSSWLKCTFICTRSLIRINSSDSLSLAILSQIRHKVTLVEPVSDQTGSDHRVTHSSPSVTLPSAPQASILIRKSRPQIIETTSTPISPRSSNTPRLAVRLCKDSTTNPGGTNSSHRIPSWLQQNLIGCTVLPDLNERMLLQLWQSSTLR